MCSDDRLSISSILLGRSKKDEGHNISRRRTREGKLEEEETTSLKIRGKKIAMACYREKGLHDSSLKIKKTMPWYSSKSPRYPPWKFWDFRWWTSFGNRSARRQTRRRVLDFMGGFHVGKWGYPLVNQEFAMENHLFFMGKSTIFYGKIQ